MTEKGAKVNGLFNESFCDFCGQKDERDCIDKLLQGLNAGMRTGTWSSIIDGASKVEWHCKKQELELKKQQLKRERLEQ